MTKRNGVSILMGGILIALVSGSILFFKGGSSGFGPGLADYEYRIAGICSLNRSSAYQIYIDCNGFNQRIESEVFKVGWNTEYLIALSHPVTKREYPDDPSNTYMLPDESITYGWIYDLKNKVAYGPLNQGDFDSKVIELNLSDVELFSPDNAKEKGEWLYGDSRFN